MGLAATCVALCLGELAVRLWLPAHDPSGQVLLVRQGELLLGVPNSRVRQRKNTGDYDVEVRFGPRGFRDPRDVAAAMPTDLLVVGDSFAFGWGVAEENRWSNLLEASTGQKVYNLAIPGQDLEGYSRLIRHAKALGARATRLIVCLCIENDVRSYQEPAEQAASAGSSSPPLAGSVRATKYWLADHSALFGLVAERVHRSRSLEAWAERAGLIQPNLDEVGRRPVTAEEIAGTADRLAGLADGFETTILLVPSRGLWLERAAGAADLVHRELLAALAARGLAVVDPRAAFEATGEPLGLYFAKDGHWNARGHRLVADCLARR